MFFKKDKKEEQEVSTKLHENEELLKDCDDYFTVELPNFWNLIERGIKTDVDLDNELKKYLKSRKVQTEQMNTVIKMFKQYRWGYGIIDDLINDEDISDIKIIRPDCVRIKKKGKRYTSDVKFKSVEDLKSFISKVAISNKINLSDIKTIGDLDCDNQIKELIKAVKEISEYAVYLDITSPELRDKGWYTMRVLIPEILEMCIPEFPFKNHPRMIQNGGVINEYPHPMP